MMSGRKPNTSSRMVLAMARKPYIVIGSEGMSKALSTAHRVFSAIGRSQFG